MKLPYLVDVVAAHVLGRRVTDATFQAWEYGVVPREVWDLVKAGGGERFSVGEHFYSEGGRTVALAEGAELSALTAEELAVVGYVVEQYRHLNAGELGDLTKSLNPELAPEEWGSNQAPSTGGDASLASVRPGSISGGACLTWISTTPPSGASRCRTPRPLHEFDDSRATARCLRGS